MPCQQKENKLIRNSVTLTKWKAERLSVRLGYSIQTPIPIKGTDGFCVPSLFLYRKEEVQYGSKTTASKGSKMCSR